MSQDESGSASIAGEAKWSMCVCRLIKEGGWREMTPTYLCSATRSRGRAEQIGQDSQTSLLWLWSRSNSLPFPEALSAMTQGFHYHHNQRPPFHQPATQKVLLTGDAVCARVCVLFCTWTHTRPCACIRSTSRGEQKNEKDQGIQSDDGLT